MRKGSWNKMVFIVVLIWIITPDKSFAQAKHKVKVMTYNIWNGFDWGKDEERRSDLVKWVAEQKPDIVGLQELCRYSDEKLAEDAGKWGHKYSVLLKKSGYSVGLSSKYPIEVVEKIRDNMHHGALHCKTGGIDVFVVHFSPSSYKKRREETKIILEKMKAVAKTNSKYLVMGDFNALSPFDADLYKNNVLLNRIRKSEAGKGETGNLWQGELDYAVLSAFMGFSLVDVCQKFTNGMEDRGSFPGRVLGAVNKETDEELVNRMQRIDYILLSEELGKNALSGKVFNQEPNWYLSDHYPVMVEFSLLK